MTRIGTAAFFDSTLSPSWSRRACTDVGPTGSEGAAGESDGAGLFETGAHSSVKSNFPLSPVPSITGRSRTSMEREPASNSMLALRYPSSIPVDFLITAGESHIGGKDPGPLSASPNTRLGLQG